MRLVLENPGKSQSTFSFGVAIIFLTSLPKNRDSAVVANGRLGNNAAVSMREGLGLEAHSATRGLPNPAFGWSRLWAVDRKLSPAVR